MTKYSQTFDSATSAKASASNVRVHFKNTCETANAIKDMKLEKAIAYLEQVKDKKRCIPYRKFNGGVGRTGQAKEFKLTQGRWPTKSVDTVLGLLKNLKANAERKELSPEEIIISHVQVNQAPKYRRRTFRAHGRVTPYMCSPCHIELIGVERRGSVPKSLETLQVD